MTKKRSRELINEALSNLKVVNAYMVYDKNYYNLIPLKVSENLFLSINEDDFIFDGFCISRFKDVESIRLKNDKCDDILRSEKLFDNLQIPEINLESWESVFTDLKDIGKNIIVQYEKTDCKDEIFTIGKIDRVYKGCLYMYHFDADGVWQSEPYRIPYNEVTSVTFESRYVSIFSKYLAPAP
ncbi:MAG: hypothetical protein LBS74_11405 [Oscillospiraceae bacterium]|jgi:hypothetical protein|nr:hypothetical protein [Oscillospiraceae bacterium]